MFAGPWENWREQDGSWLQTFAIVTRPADTTMAELHDRTPLMLTADLLPDWLHGSAQAAGELAASAALPALQWHRVGRAVGDVRNLGAQLVAAVEGGEEGEAAGDRGDNGFSLA